MKFAAFIIWLIVLPETVWLKGRLLFLQWSVRRLTEKRRRLREQLDRLNHPTQFK